MLLVERRAKVVEHRAEAGGELLHRFALVDGRLASQGDARILELRVEVGEAEERIDIGAAVVVADASLAEVALVLHGCSRRCC